MNWAVLRREWGAVTFVLTVVAGMIVVPLALYFANVSPAPITTPNLTTSSSARASDLNAGWSSTINTVGPMAKTSVPWDKP